MREKCLEVSSKPLCERPEDDEPTSPANAMILLTLGFVFAAFVLPLLFAGIQSANKDIAGADASRLVVFKVDNCQERGKPVKK